MSQQVAQSFGPNISTRIAGSAQLMLEPGEVAPTLPWYQPLVPFYQTQVASGDASANTSSSEDTEGIWQQAPRPYHLVFYVGDDVEIPLLFNDPAVADDDMATGYTWVSQIRTLHTYRSTLIAEFDVTAEFTTGTDETNEFTKITLSLPRAENKISGKYHWELAAYDADDQLRTWLYGYATILPRTTSTDVLPGTSVTSGGGAVVAPMGFVVGPNGRVP